MGTSKAHTPAVIHRRDFLRASLAGALSAALTTRGRAQQQNDSCPNIVVILMDTARKDHLSCYGYTRETTPFLRRLADESRVYTNAYSTSCWTVPAHGSLFTGLYAASHAATWEHYRLDEHLTTVAQVLRSIDYRTIGICENPALRANLGFAQGFDSYSIPRLLPRSADSNALREFDAAVRGEDTRPFFIFVNLVGPHDPYNSAGQFANCFLTDPAYKDAVYIDFLDVLVKGRPLEEPWLTHLVEHYDAELRYTDYLVMKMVEVLRAYRKWDNTAFIVVADHGENLGDHGMLNHQFCLYESVVRVPLLVHFPELFPAGSQDTNFVQLTDLFPTVLRLADLDPARYPNQGRSLLPGETLPQRPVICEYYEHARFRAVKTADRRWRNPRVRRFKRRLTSIRFEGMKLIRGSDGRQELFDLENDPEETRDLSGMPTFAAVKDDLAYRMQQFLKQCRTAQPPPTEKSVPLDEEAEDALKALGYL